MQTCLCGSAGPSGRPLARTAPLGGLTPRPGQARWGTELRLQDGDACRSAAGPLRVASPVQEAVSSRPEMQPAFPSSLNGAVEPRQGTQTISSSSILEPVRADMEQMAVNLQNVVGNRHQLLMDAADQIFGAGGKKLRPAIVFMVARATAELAGLPDITDKQRRLAEITEMIHTASLVHDDVVDDCHTRRGKVTVNSRYGTKVAVLAGDFLFAQSSIGLANLDNLEVIKLISQVIADFANGEISQIGSLFDTGISMEQYAQKSFYKTATLMAASCKSAAVFSGVDASVKEAMFEYGRHLGLAFQVVDDILDFTQSSEQLGKPQGQDLATGNLTAPAIFALRSSVAAELRELIDGEFLEEGSLHRAILLVKAGGGIAAAQQLARQEGDLALAALECLTDCPAKRSLEMMVDYVLNRLY